MSKKKEAKKDARKHSCVKIKDLKPRKAGEGIKGGKGAVCVQAPPRA